ncbi:MAG: hypothetical protein E7324_02840 [Clostridiales bacterium]|nr:hypothetical protein [Clostridiales bacterium]
MMYHNNMKMNMNAAEAKAKMRLLIIVAVVLAVGCAVLGVLMMKNSAYKTQAGQEFSRRMNGAVSSAVDEVNRMSGAAASDSMSRLARVRQYVYFMEQLNDLSMDLAGGENGRLVSAAAFKTLYADLDEFEKVLQGNKSSTLDVRTKLFEDLVALQGLLLGY